MGNPQEMLIDELEDNSFYKDATWLTVDVLEYRGKHYRITVEREPVNLETRREKCPHCEMERALLG